MKKFFFMTNAKWLFAVLLLAGIVSFNACNKDEPDPADDPIASFQFEVSTDNYLEVSFTNFSQNAVSYNWDFGDGNTSTDESPVHTYGAEGAYTVTLTATGAEGTTASTKSESFTLSNPNSQLALIAGTEGKKWYLNRENVALGIGPGLDNNTWWSFGGVTPHGDRPCILDDYYEFHPDGTFTLNTGGTVFVDAFGNGGWLDSEQCVDQSETDKLVGEAGEDLSIYATGGDYSYTFDPTTMVLTLTGEGTYIGLPNKTNTGDNYIPEPQKVYEVFNLAEGEIADTMSLGLVINSDPNGAGVWNYYLVSYHDENDLPEIPGALPSASFSVQKDGSTVTFTNTSKNYTSSSWDFGDGGTSTEDSPVYTYASTGDFTVTLSVMDDAGNSDEDAQVVTITADVFTGDVLSSETGKVWNLVGDQSLKVGPSKGNGEWWTMDAATAEARACLVDDDFVFLNDGTFNYDSKGEVWCETYLGVPADGCYADADLPAPYDVYGSGSYTFEVTEASGDEPAKIKVIGAGAFIGFNKAINGAELSFGNVDPPAEVEYEVFDYYTTPEKEVLSVTININDSGTSWWTFTLESLK
jgi:PKD repeat protein